MKNRFGVFNPHFLMEEAGEGGDAGGGSAAAGTLDAGDSAGGEDQGGKKASADQQTDSKGSGVDDEKAALLKDMMKWKGQARTLQEQIEALKTQSAELEKLKQSMGDLDLEQIKSFAEQQKELARKEAEKKGEYDRIVAQMKEENQKRVATIEEERNTLKDQVNSLAQQIEQLTIGRAFSDSGFIRENSVLPASIAQKEFGAYFDFENGKLVGYDKPRGVENRTKIVDDMGEPKSFEAVIEQLYAKHPDSKSLIRAKRKPGAGSGSTDQGSGKPESGVKLRGVQKIASGLQKSGS